MQRCTLHLRTLPMDPAWPSRYIYSQSSVHRNKELLFLGTGSQVQEPGTIREAPLLHWCARALLSNAQPLAINDAPHSACGVSMQVGIWPSTRGRGNGAYVPPVGPAVGPQHHDGANSKPHRHFQLPNSKCNCSGNLRCSWGTGPPPGGSSATRCLLPAYGP